MTEGEGGRERAVQGMQNRSFEFVCYGMPCKPISSFTFLYIFFVLRIQLGKCALPHRDRAEYFVLWNLTTHNDTRTTG